MVNTPNLTDAIRREMNAPAPHTALLEAEGLSMRLGGALVLQDVEFTLAAGEVLAVVGPNGAGKSTLLKLVCGDWRPTAGDVRLRGYAVGSYGARELALQRAVMSQSAVVTAAFTAREVVMMGRYPYGASPADAGIVQSALRRTETEHLAERFYPTLSGGEQARVTLARVLAQAAPLMLLDEPTATLDLRHQQIVMRLAREHAAAGGAVLTIVHDLNLAARFADRVLLLAGGRSLALGAPGAVLTEATIARAFDTPVAVMPHPAQPDRPLIVPLEPETNAS